jgi:hypothetical protein
VHALPSLEQGRQGRVTVAGRGLSMSCRS